MSRWRTFGCVLLAGGLVGGCYLWEGRERLAWQIELPSVCQLAGICDDERHLAVIRFGSQPLRLEKYNLATGAFVNWEELVGLDTLYWGHVSPDGSWFECNVSTTTETGEEGVKFVFLHREGSAGQFEIVDDFPGSIKFPAFSPDSQCIASSDDDEVRVIDLKTQKIVERYSLPTASRNSTRFTCDPDWLLVQSFGKNTRDLFAIRRSTKQILSLGTGAFADGVGNPRALGIQKVTTERRGRREFTIVRVDLTSNPPRETPTSVYFPAHGLATPDTDGTGNLLVYEDVVDRWRLARELIERLSGSRVTPPKWMEADSGLWIMFLMDAAGRRIGGRRILRLHSGFYVPLSGELIIDVDSANSHQDGSGSSVITAYPSRLPPRRWTWGVLLLMTATGFMYRWRARASMTVLCNERKDA